ncbi:hypothetical protein [Sphingomonas faeni]|uniref:hypothetical protein n=1 Tax=Sphingomonas faeni TaxID=185950 RepID=UPI003353381B
MEQQIIHACGHEQGHYLTGYDSQKERKAKWLKTTTCRDCFVAEKRADEVAAAALSSAAVSPCSSTANRHRSANRLGVDDQDQAARSAIQLEQRRRL